MTDSLWLKGELILKPLICGGYCGSLKSRPEDPDKGRGKVGRSGVERSRGEDSERKNEETNKFTNIINRMTYDHHIQLKINENIHQNNKYKATENLKWIGN